MNGHENIAFITVYFQSSIIAHINVNWLSPVKVRTTLIGGEKKMLVWNDLEADEKVKVYDKGVQITSQEGVYELLVSYCGFRGKAGAIPGSIRSAFRNESGHDSGMNPVTDSDIKPVTLGRLSES